jgi:hypothetical protein
MQSPEMLETFADKLRTTLINGDLAIGEWSEKGSDISVNTTLAVSIIPSRRHRILIAHFWANRQASATYGFERTVRS